MLIIRCITSINQYRAPISNEFVVISCCPRESKTRLRLGFREYVRSIPLVELRESRFFALVKNPSFLARFISTIAMIYIPRDCRINYRIGTRIGRNNHAHKHYHIAHRWLFSSHGHSNMRGPTEQNGYSSLSLCLSVCLPLSLPLPTPFALPRPPPFPSLPFPSPLRFIIYFAPDQLLTRVIRDNPVRYVSQVSINCMLW